MLKRAPLLIALLVLAFVFVIGVGRLFQIRFERGDIYPPYSSLRADPLGSKALFDSLDALPGVTVRRNLQPLEQMDEASATLLFLGANAEELKRASRPEVEAVERFMESGGRVVVSCRPENRPALLQRRFAPADVPAEHPGILPPVSVYQRWNLVLHYDRLPRTAAGGYEPVEAARVAEEPLPDSIFWHSAIFFGELGEDWRVIYDWEGRAVFIERPFGEGSLVFSADSYYLSNEAMRNQRYLDLLTWLIGRHEAVIFDETHLGISERAGIARLMRSYRLHGVIGGFLLLAALFIWKNSVSFVPPHPGAATGAEWVEGKDATAGFINLLRRGIGPRQLTETCVAEWKKSFGHSPTAAPKVRQIEELLAEENARSPRERNPVETYRAISRVLSRRAVLKPADETASPRDRTLRSDSL